ncbi:MAG: glycosyltransferase family 2 protein [Actinobacteria bacterium]|nr:glycosyltransferase family 2 protein [Actinomycetota bacterium]
MELLGRDVFVKLSIVSPVFNEEDVISVFMQALRSLMENSGIEFEVILVDDGSTDLTASAIRSFGWSRVRLLRLVKNSGHMAALDAGIRASRGDFVVTLDADLQHPPELILPMLNLAQSDGLDVVYAVRKTRGEDSFFKRNSAKIYYRMMKTLSKTEVTPSAADFRLISRKVVSVIRELPIGRQVFRILIPSLGFRSGRIEFTAQPRAAGSSKYTLRKMVSLWSASVLSSSTMPLTLATRIGFVISSLSLVGFGYVLFSFLSGRTVEGWASLLSTTLLLFGVQFTILGIVGNYLGVVVEAVRRVPPYILRDED